MIVNIIKDSKVTWAKMVADRGFGMCNTGQWLGVMVAPEKYIDSCPRSWCFVDVRHDESKQDLAVRIQEALDYMTEKGRSSFPIKTVFNKKTGDYEEVQL